MLSSEEYFELWEEVSRIGQVVNFWASKVAEIEAQLGSWENELNVKSLNVEEIHVKDFQGNTKAVLGERNGGYGLFVSTPKPVEVSLKEIRKRLLALEL